jgi:hypothetical protein
MTPIDEAAIDAAVDEQLQGRQSEDDDEPRRPGRPKGSRNATKPIETPAVSPGIVSAPPEGETSKEALVVWPHIIENILRPKGLGPDAVMIAVTRIGMGPFPTDAIPIGTFDGSSVTGDTDVSPGDAIVNHVCEIYHLGRRNQGPALYRLRAYYKVKGDTIRNMEVKLDDPAEITAQRARAIRWEQARSLGRPPAGGSVYPVATYPPAPMPYAAAAPTVAPGPMGQTPQEMLGMVQQVMGMVSQMNEQARQAAMAAGQPPPPPIVVQQAPPPQPPAPAAPPGPRLTPEEEEMIEEIKFRRRAERLGYVPREAIPQVAASTSQQVAAVAANPVDGIRALLTTFKQIDKLRNDVNDVLGVEPDDAPDPPAAQERPPFTVTKVPMANYKGKEIFWPGGTEAGFLGFAKAFIASNLEVSTELGLSALQKLSTIVDQTSFGKLMAQLVEKGGAAADVARLGSGIVASGPPLSNGVVPRRGPSA